jgi:Rha family phage regulatory protein
MNTQSPATPELRPELAIINGEIKTTSLKIAEHFGKQHKSVLRTIKNLDCSPEFHKRNFALMEIDVEIGMGKTRKDPAYELTRDGFTFLAMGFTGAKAAQWKEAYITAFNRMEAELQGTPSQELPKPGKSKITRTLTTFQNGEVICTEKMGDNMRMVSVTNVEAFCDFILDIMPLEFAPEVLKTLARKVIGTRVVGGV